MHIFFIKIALFRKTQRGLKMNLRLILNCNFLIRVPVNFFKFIATGKQIEIKKSTTAIAVTF